MIRLPQFFELNTPEIITSIPDISIVRYRQSESEFKNEVFLSRHLLIFVLKGKKILHHTNGDTTIQAGEAIFVKSGCYAMSEIIPENDYFESLLFFINNELLIDFFRDQKQSIFPTEGNDQEVCKFRTTSRLNAFLCSVTDQYLLQGLKDPRFDRLKSMELFYQLTFDEQENQDLLNFLASINVSRSINLHLVMENFYDRPLSLQEYAGMVSKSLATFKRDFEKEFHTSPGHWIRERRLQKARNLLRFSDKSVTQICYEAGFENLSNFVLRYKERFGITPKQFQKSNGLTENRASA